MKTFFATLFAVASAVPPEHKFYPEEASGDHFNDVPTGDFWHQVDDFDAWKEIRDQHEYEERLGTEAELMVALEALREALVDIDHDIDIYEDCIEHCQDCISEHDEMVAQIEEECHDNADMCSDWEGRVRDLQERAADVKDALAEDRAVLVLYCQQFAFAPDMVGACADILTCQDTHLSFRADVFSSTTPVFTHDNHHDDHSYGAYDYGHYQW